MNLKGLLRMPPKDRMAEYAGLLLAGKVTVNDVRRNENINERAWAAVQQDSSLMHDIAIGLEQARAGHTTPWADIRERLIPEERCTGCADWCDCHNFDARCSYCSENES